MRGNKICANYNMYHIFLHVASIAILEITFFFYYIGPKETDMFLVYIQRIIDTPVFDNHYLLQQFANNSSEVRAIDYQPIVIPIITNSTKYAKNYLYNESLQGLSDRELHNRELFLQSVKYWAIFTAFSFGVFIFQCYYHKCNANKQDKNVVTSTLSDSSVHNVVMVPYRKTSIDMEDIEMVPYRKTSFDIEDIESKGDEQSKPVSHDIVTRANLNNLCKIGFNYVIFGGCIVAFQYLFFRYIALKYKPLSIEEIKYFLFTSIVPNT